MKEIEKNFNVRIKITKDGLKFFSSEDIPSELDQFIIDLFNIKRDKNILLSKEELKKSINSIKDKSYSLTREYFVDIVFVSSKGKRIKPKSENQRRYVELIRKKDLVFCVGPAGSGKTYLAIASALSYLFDKKVERIILTKPVVEAGEKLGFLPGTFLEKVDPHFRPLYDALYDLIEVEKVTRLIENNIIEIAPLAYMRGRTLNDSFIILDEAQNTTYSQMKMFLTRMGFNSKVVITGDITQIDIENPKDSGLVKAIKILEKIDDIGIVKLDKVDIVRNPIVQKIVEAYENFENYKKKDKNKD
ncbi:MAG: PhoH family protein [Caldisericia bacterium]|nr:PhoH family protein [Caldisericia bacterium]